MKAKGEEVIDSTQNMPFLAPLPGDALVVGLDLLGQLRNPWPRSPQMKHPEPEVVVLPSEPCATNKGFEVVAVELDGDVGPNPLPFLPFLPFPNPFLPFSMFTG